MSTTSIPQTVSLEQAREAVAVVLERRGRTELELGPETPLRSLGFDSLDRAELFLALEAVVGRRLDPRSAETVESVGDLVRLRPA